MARILIAGPEYKKAIAGPRPAPLFLIPAKRGSIVQEHTASIAPETDATPYASHFFALGPKYFKIAPFDTNRAIAPAIKKAGTRHVRTCADKYSSYALQPLFRASKNICIFFPYLSISIT